jgi:uncharacterized protein
MSLDLLEEHIHNGNIDELRSLLESQPGLASTTTSSNVSPLMLACYYKKSGIADEIIKHLPSLTFFEAVAAGKFNDVAHQFSQNQDLIHDYSNDGFTALGLASYFGHEDITRYLLLKGADPNIPSDNGFRVFPIHSAAASNNNPIAKMLLEAGAQVNVIQKSGVSPLHSAAHSGNIELLILLLEAGADVTLQTENGQRAADMASEKGFADIARILSE